MLDALFDRFWASLKQRTAARPTQPHTVNGMTKSRGECRPTQSLRRALSTQKLKQLLTQALRGRESKLHKDALTE
ncbi:Hypothetical predicted protein [Pelobates cultripes]|uniref:Uncharacterized protein n=1 Tax=Pelobates cultripes TaxID=61616 RepID=A0AAD1VM46_PELCU|nr:Hypothetical predicted protein [Pelobates cultripes]